MTSPIATAPPSCTTGGARATSEHDGVCECERLAAAMGCDSRTITFDFCLRVLQRHWTMNCRHGCPREPVRLTLASHWHDESPSDAVRAILISNAPIDL